MPRVSVVAKNYAKALFLASKKTSSLDKISAELDVFKQNFSTSFAHELKNPVIAKNDLVRIIQEVTEKFELSRLTSNFFASIVRNRRLNLFPEIYEEFTRLVKQQKNILEVEVISVVKTNKLHLDKVKLLVAKKYPDKTILIRETIKEKILGGLQIKIGSEVIDASLENQLETLKKQCLAAIN
jgi:F-type H+-transporting ATPase subunit delta